MSQDNLLALPADLPTIDPNKDYLTELVGENKKFKDAQALARSKAEADQFIEIMKRRQDELRADNELLRADNTTKARLEELINQLSTKSSNSEITPAKEVTTSQPIDMKEIETLVSSKVQEIETSKKQTDNYNTVVSKLKEHYGANYQDVLRQKIDETEGLTLEDVNTMAKKSPTALFRTLGLDQPKQAGFQSPARSNQRSDSFSPSAPKARTWSYYQDLKTKDPQLYYNREIAIQMTKDAIELGDAFKDGNYFVKGLHEQ